MFSQILVANRGEVSIRAFRAAFELGARTVAVFPHEDRVAGHRMKAGESYQIGDAGHPVRAYLPVDGIIRVARRAGAGAIYPGYGFLAENPDLAAACAADGTTFIGPKASVLELTGNKARFPRDTGKITACRVPGGAGISLDGDAALGAEVGAHFDSLLVKLTCRGQTFASALARARRAVAEFRIRGITANILSFLAYVTVNKPFGDQPTTVQPERKLPPFSPSTANLAWARQKLTALGPAGLATALRRTQNTLGVTDTTFRDGDQSLLATRVRTKDLLAVVGHLSRTTPQPLSIEARGGAAYDVGLHFLHEKPWDRLAALREEIPNICLQTLLRGRNTVGYTPCPDQAARAFVQEAAATGIDIFSTFDALNGVDHMRPAIDAVRETGSTIAELALCYTGDLSNPSECLYTLDYYLRRAEPMVSAGAQVLAINDMAGLLRPATITAPKPGTQARTAIGPVTKVEGSDLLIVISDESENTSETTAKTGNSR